jgi:hypothetical protein
MKTDYRVPQRDLFEFLLTFSQVFKKKSKLQQEKAQHLQKGLEKMSEAKSMVDILSKDAFKKQ